MFALRYFRRRRSGKRPVFPFSRTVALLGWAALLLSWSGAGSAVAAGRFVAPTGNDAAAGSIEAPWRTLPVAIPRLVAGDTLYLRGGRYDPWNLDVAVSGTPAAPIVVRSYPGEIATLDPTHPAFRTPRNGEWRETDPGLGCFKSRNSVDLFVGLAWLTGLPGYENERLRLTPYVSRSLLVAPGEAYDPTTFYAGPGTFEEANRLEIRLAKTAEVRAVEERYGRVLDEEVPNPADYAIAVTEASWALRILGSYLVIKDLVLEPGYHTVLLGAGAHHLVLDGLTIWIGRNGISVGGPGVHHVTVTRSRLYGDCPAWVFRSDADSDVPPAPAEHLRTNSIDLAYDTHDWEISYNHIRGSAQYLIETRIDTAPAGPKYNLSIHHNRMENAAEDAMRFDDGVALGRIEVYENFVSNCLRAITAGQYTPVFDGPLLVYRNVAALLRDPAVNRVPGLLTWNHGLRHGFQHMFRLAGAGFTTRNAHLYHNTLVLLNSAGKGLHLMPQITTDARYANNLMVLVNGRVNDTIPDGPGQVVDGNLYWKMNTIDTERLIDSYDTVPAVFAATGMEQHGLGAIPKRGTDPQFAALALDIANPTAERWAIAPASERTQPWHYTLSAASPARGAGIAIPAHPVLGVLPDTRSSLDIGALPYGTTAADFAFFPFDPAPNQAPLAAAGADQTGAPPEVSLHGAVTDDGHPTGGVLVARWRMVSGPGQVRFENPNALDTQARFSSGGSYVLELTASDGEKTATDQVQIDTALPFQSLETRLTASTDDADEGGPASVSLTGARLPLGTGKTVGTRFTGLAIPQGAAVIGAYLQFASYQPGGDPTPITISGQAADHAETFAATLANLTARPRTQAAVVWDLPPWGARYESGAIQRSPNLAPIVQEIVSRPGWTSGNAIALFCAGTGSRSAASADYEGEAGAVLHVDFVPSGPLDAPEGVDRQRLAARVVPNPSAGAATLRFTLPRPGPVLAELFDVRGRRVGVLADSPWLEAGTHELRIEKAAEPGVFFYRLRVGDESISGRCLLLR